MNGYVEVDNSDYIPELMPGFRRTTSMLRYTPVTISQEEVTHHQDPHCYDGTNGTRVDPCSNHPRSLENMFHPAHYPQFSAPPLLRTRFAETTKVHVGITMYQEPCGPPEASPGQWAEKINEAGTVCSTFHSVAQNLQIFNNPTNPLFTRMRRREVTVSLVADGRTRINGSRDNIDEGIDNLNSLAKMGAYYDIDRLYADDGPLARAGRLMQEDLDNREREGEPSRRCPKYSVDGGKAVYLHLFEAEIRYGDFPAMQFMFCLKEFNAGKLDSHLWFFDLLTAHFHRVTGQEVYTVLLDAGTVPGETAVVELVAEMHNNSDVAGCCGQITTEGNHNPWKMLSNPIVACQNFEYKTANFLDKQMQSLFGYIEVLPGAFSAYKWSKLSEGGPLERPLAKYFKSCTAAGGMSPFEGNMYLAEDRILCYELVIRSRNKLSYIGTATAKTDVPDDMSKFIKQRRRWLNGSQFAIYYAIWNGLLLCGLWRGRHSCARKLAFLVEFLFLLLSNTVAWFALGNTFLFSYLFVRGMCGVGFRDFQTYGFVLFEYLKRHPEFATYYRDLYLVLFSATLVLAMGSKPDTKHSLVRVLYKLLAFLWALAIMMVFGFVIFTMVEGFTTTNWRTLDYGVTEVISLSSTLFLLSIFVGGLLNGDIGHVVLCIVPYLIWLPTMLNMVQVFAFCNLHDLSWGTKGLDSTDDSKQDEVDRRSGFRCLMVLLWIITNGLLVAFICAGDHADEQSDAYELHKKVQTLYLMVLAVVAGGMSALKLACSVLWLARLECSKMCGLCSQCMCSGRCWNPPLLAVFAAVLLLLAYRALSPDSPPTA